jgi:drug/metabolite transporter (DMT)-like permease
MKKELNKAYFALALVSFFWGTTYVASKVGAQHMPGLFVSGIRQFVSGAILVAYFLMRGHQLPGWSIMKKISVQSVFLLCIANGCLTWSLEYISGGLAAIIAALVPLFIALFTVWLSRVARITRVMLIGLVVGFAGVLTIFYTYLNELSNSGFVFGVVLAVISTLSWSFGTVYSSKQKPPIDVLFNVGLQMLVAGIVVLAICAITGKYINPVNINQESWLALSYLVVFGSLVAYTAYVFVITKLPPTQVSIYAYINPVVAVLLGWLLLSEKMNINMIVGTLITLTGVWMVNRESKKVKI